LVLAVVLIIAGVGLLGMHPWARWLCVAYGVLTILVGVSSLVVQLAYLNPAMEQWNRDLQENVLRANQGKGGVVVTPAPQTPQSPAMNSASSVVYSLIGMGYAVGLMVVMFLPNVSAAFARRNSQTYDDYDDRFEDGREEERLERGPKGPGEWEE
jgi:hypothetical protein